MTTTDAAGFKHNRWGYKNRKCKCLICRTDYRAYARTRGRQSQPSFLANEVDRLTAELDAAEMHIEALREENAMLHCRLQELNP